MNPEICKKCECNLYLFNNVFYNKKEILCMTNKLVDNYYIDDDYFNMILKKYDNLKLDKNSQWCFDISRKIDDLNIDKIEINKTCPYYIEHKLAEWSKNE